MYIYGESGVDDARYLRPGDIMTEYGEVVEATLLEDDLVDVTFYDGFNYGKIVFHTYEDVELTIL